MPTAPTLPLDITRCANVDCPHHLSCMRYLSYLRGYRRTVKDFTPDESGHCDNYIQEDKACPA